MNRRIFPALLLCVTATAQAALLGRAPVTPNGTDYQAYFDTAHGLTWLANANLAASNQFGVSGIDSNGSLRWTTAQAWIASMNAANYLGVSGWRLPTVNDTGAPGCNEAIAGTDCGWNVDLGTGELAAMFFNTLGNIGRFDVNGQETGCGAPSPSCLTSVGTFSNLQSHYYWYGTEYSASGSSPNFPDAWTFDFIHGYQYSAVKTNKYFAWALLDGDPFGAQSVVPIPAAAWLFGGALGVLGWTRRRQARDGVSGVHASG